MSLIAVPIGAATVAIVYPLLRDTYGLGGETGLFAFLGLAGLLVSGALTPDRSPDPLRRQSRPCR